MKNERCLPISAVFNPKVKEHNPPFELWRGMPDPHYDKPERVTSIQKGLRYLMDKGILEIIEPTGNAVKNIIRETHSADYVEYFEWLSDYLSTQPEMAVPEITSLSDLKVDIKKYPAFAFPSMFPRGRSNQEPRKRLIDLGLFSNDTGTPVMANTFEMASLSAETAIVGADLIKSGHKIVYCGNRPPGHHAERDRMGGYCYFNNAAVAAQQIFDYAKGKITILDIDIHHGNGTQQIFYDSDAIDYYSLHVESEYTAPSFGGYKEEIGVGTGVGHNHNYPFKADFSEKEYLRVFNRIIQDIQISKPECLILSLGFDGHINDPLHVGSLSTEAYIRMARRIRNIDTPLLITQEGGYDIGNLDKYLVAFLESLTSSYEN